MIAVASIGVLTAGCYTLQPATAAVPVPGTRLAFAINDVGRVALGGSMGPALLRVNGSLQSKDGDDYLVSVSGVDLLQGGFQAWAGESVRINTSYVSAVYERKFSKGKTIVAVGALAAAVAVVSARGIPSFIDGTETPPTDTIISRRGRLPARRGLPPFLRKP
jgi:hypothetical protein